MTKLYGWPDGSREFGSFVAIRFIPRCTNIFAHKPTKCVLIFVGKGRKTPDDVDQWESSISEFSVIYLILRKFLRISLISVLIWEVQVL